MRVPCPVLRQAAVEIAGAANVVPRAAENIDADVGHGPWWVGSARLHYYTFEFEEPIAWRHGRFDAFRPTQTRRTPATMK